MEVRSGAMAAAGAVRPKCLLSTTATHHSRPPRPPLLRPFFRLLQCQSPQVRCQRRPFPDASHASSCAAAFHHLATPSVPRCVFLSSVWFLPPSSLTVVDTALISHPLLSPLAHRRQNVVPASLARVERSHTLPARPLAVAYPGRSRSPGLHRVLPSAAPRHVEKRVGRPSLPSKCIANSSFIFWDMP
ncbi:uncharacterized protein [Triticum aestivum]|uniref:uncharacterized protein n=1 Tax=Triticum aestivum TaxID=4565 RepID=UPI001D007CBD|nr:uncharacterized protein LOC123121428 [Triticum aestivum]